MIADISYSELKVGDSAELSRTVTEVDIEGFAAVSGDYNPLHMNARAAARGPFKQRVAHGMFPAALISAVLGTVLPGKNTIYIEQHLQFKAPVFIGDTITARVEVTELKPERNIAGFKTEVFNQAGKKVIKGHAVIMKKN